MDEIQGFINGQNLLSKLIKVLIILVVFVLIKRIIQNVFDTRIESKLENGKNNEKKKTVFSLVKSIINFVLYFIAITYILNVFNINTSSIIAVAGVGGMAIAFASKSLIEDVISGAIIITENQFNIGDLVTIKDTTATVKNVGLRVTKLEDIDGREIIIPNGEINKVINYSINDMRAAVTVYISDNKPYEYVEKALQKACETVYSQNNNITKPEIWGIEELDCMGYQVLIAAKVPNGKQWEIQRKIRREIVRELQNANISFARLLKDQ